MGEKILITAALPYANGPVHLGHLAGAYLPADIFARFCRMKQRETLFICGSDEHGVAITIAADREGTTPKHIVDKYHALISESFAAVGMSFDHYGRTSNPVHHETAQSFFSVLHKKGLFSQKTEEQYFDESAGMFLPDRYIKGECPTCHNPGAYGDQCEKCGSSLNPNELINPVSAISGTAPVKRATTHWYLPMGDYQQWLERWLSTKSDWKPNVLGQCKSWLAAGLADRAMTRDLNWGIPVPLEEAAGKVLYVWFDAPIGYISATREWSEKNGNPEGWKAFWQDEKTRLFHFIGKDNIVFHCLIFPSILHAHGGYVLPENVPANEFLNLEGQKFSTSRNWAVWLHDALQDFPADYIRYGLATLLPETKDADFTWKEFQARINNDLGDVYGNLVFRTLSFVQRFFESRLPEPVLLPEDEAILQEIEKTATRASALFDQFKVKDALSEIMTLARLGNKYFTDQEPWKTRKSNPERCATALFVSAQVCGSLSVLLEPIIPGAAARIRKQFGLHENAIWSHAHAGCVAAGTSLAEGDIPFKKIEDEAIAQQLARLQPPQPVALPAAEFEALSPETTFDQFQLLDLRAGKIQQAEPVPKSEKLLKLTVDIGVETRTIMSGIAKHFQPEALTGKTVVVVANLAPRKIMNVESRGMLLTAAEPQGELRLIETTAVPGSKLS